MVRLAVQQGHLPYVCAVLRVQLHEPAWMYMTILLNLHKHSMYGLLLGQDYLLLHIACPPNALVISTIPLIAGHLREASHIQKESYN